MAFGNWISNLIGVFEEGPMKDLTEEVAKASESKKSAEEVVITDEFRNTFNVNSPVRENLRNSFLFSMLLMASHIILADGNWRGSRGRRYGCCEENHRKTRRDGSTQAHGLPTDDRRLWQSDCFGIE